MKQLIAGIGVVFAWLAELSNGLFTSINIEFLNSTYSNVLKIGGGIFSWRNIHSFNYISNGLNLNMIAVLSIILFAVAPGFRKGILRVGRRDNN